MSIYFSDIDCAQEGPISETLNAITGRINCTVTLRCDFEDRLLLADDLLLNRREWPLIFTAFTPKAMSCSIVPGDEWLGATTEGQFRASKTSLVTVNYGIPDTAETSNYDSVAESLEPVGEFSRLPAGNFRWTGQSGRLVSTEEAPSFLNIKLRLVRRIYRLNELPPGSISSFGKVNIASYYSPLLGLTFAAETLLYDAPQPDRTLSSTGDEGFNLTQNFIYNPNGWNKYFRPETNAWENIYHVNSATAYKMYVPADFSGII